jgi:hypothetical protein
VVAARVDEERRAGLERAPTVLVRGRQRPVLAQERRERGQPHRQVVSELVERTLGAEVGVEGVGEGEGVDDQGAAGVVSDQQHRPLGRDPLQAAHLGAEVDVGRQPVGRKRGADELGIARRQRVVVALAAQIGHRRTGGRPRRPQLVGGQLQAASRGAPQRAAN